MSTFSLELVESELKIVLEALCEREKRMAEICESPQDEDEVADIGNDLIKVRLLLKQLKERAVKQYGVDILNFSREPF